MSPKPGSLQWELNCAISQRDEWQACHKSALDDCVRLRARAERAEAALREQLETKKWYTDRAERSEAELKRVPLWIAGHGYATGHGDTVEAMLAELVSDVKERAEAELKAMREALQAIDDGYTKGSAPRLDGGYSLACIARRALAPSPAGPDGKSLAVLYCMDRAEEDVKLLREALEGMIAVAEGRFDGNPHADIDALAKARAALAPSPAGEKS